MKIIFLDVDGVLQSGRSVLVSGMQYPSNGLSEDVVSRFDQAGLILLRKLCAADPNVKVVMLTTWARSIPAHVFARELQLPVIGKIVPDNRSEDIRAWLKESETTVTHYVSLDDSTIPTIGHPNNAITIDGDEGITFQNIKKAGDILDVDWARPIMFF